MVSRIKRVAWTGVRGPRHTVWLSPLLLATALLQTVDCEVGKSLRLTTFAIEVSGDDQIEDFLPNTWVYRVGTRGESMVVRTEAADPESAVTYALEAGDVVLEAGVIGIGGGEVTSYIPLGRSTLTIKVLSPGRVEGRYTVRLARGLSFPCTEAGILNAVAFGGGPHAFDCDGPTTVVARTEITAHKDVALDGEGELTIEAGAGRVFFIAGGVAAELAGMQLTDGSADYGGALYNQGHATLTDVRITSNSATLGGGGVYSGPGSQLVLDGVTIDDNTAAGPSEAAGGGLYLEGSTAVIRNSVVENNVARGRSGQGGRRGRGGGLFVSNGELVVQASRIAANSAIGGDGSGEFNSAGYSRGGGLHLTSSTAVITNSAVSGNACQGGFARVGGGFASGGGVWLEGGALTIAGTTIDNNLADGVSGPWEAGAGGGLLVLLDARFIAVNSTISGNRADYTGAMEVGLRASAAFYSSTIAFNSIDENNSAMNIRSDSEVTFSHTIVANAGRCYGSVRSLGYNVFGPNFGCNVNGDVNGDIADVDPQLEPLADNGGPTRTHALPETSPALDAGDPAGCVGEGGEPLASDQRGATRPVGVCDIGAVELQRP